MNWKMEDFEPSLRMPFGRATDEVWKWVAMTPTLDLDEIRRKCQWCITMSTHQMEKWWMTSPTRIRDGDEAKAIQNAAKNKSCQGCVNWE